MKARVAIRIQPRASRERLACLANGQWKLSVTAPAVEGKANRACLEFFARGLRVPRAAVRIATGEASRHKRIEIDGIAQEALDRFLQSQLAETGSH